MTNDKLKELKRLINKINEKSETETISLASDRTYTYGWIYTPWPTLNKLIGGFSRGRFTTIAGPSQTGKTALILQTIAYNQKIDKDFICLWSDFESQFDNKWAATLGIDLDRLIILQYTDKDRYMEVVLDKALELIKSKAIAMWAIDSIGAMTPKSDIIDKSGDRALEENNMLRLQVKLGEFYRKANVTISPSKDFNGCAVLLVGHVYSVPTTSGAKLEEVRGGNAVKHWANLRLLTRRGPRADWPKEIQVMGIDGKPVKLFPGWSGRVKLDKSRQNANEGQEILLNFYHGRGFDWKDSTVNAAIGLGIINKAAASYSCELLPGGKLRGIEAVLEFFEKDEEAYNKLALMVDAISLENKEIVDKITTEEDNADIGD